MAYSYIHSALLVLIISLAIIYQHPYTSKFIRNSSPFTNSTTPPAIFIFGDSTADVGTNNYISNTTIRADIPYYGIDFDDSRPTGRFSNGLITVDFICQLMGFKRSPPPFLFLSSLRSDFERKKFRGVNFASSGAGLLDTTLDELNVLSLSDQVNQFVMVQGHLMAWMGQSSIDYLLSKSIFLVSIASNDLINYFNSNSTMPQEVFIRTLMTSYEKNIKALYNVGARKFGIISVLPLGCLPSRRVFNATGGCSDILNEFSINFYLELDTLLHKMSSELHGFKYSLGNTYKMTTEVIQNPARFDITHVDSACCGSGRLNAEPCNVTGNLCKNRSEYVFWDGFHPTQAAAQLAAQSFYGGDTRFVSPINFGQLAADI